MLLLMSKRTQNVPVANVKYSRCIIKLNGSRTSISPPIIPNKSKRILQNFPKKLQRARIQALPPPRHTRLHFPSSAPKKAISPSRHNPSLKFFISHKRPELPELNRRHQKQNEEHQSNAETQDVHPRQPQRSQKHQHKKSFNIRRQPIRRPQRPDVQRIPAKCEKKD